MQKCQICTDNYLSGEAGQISPQLLFNILPGVQATAMKKKTEEIGQGGTSGRKLSLCADAIIIYQGSKRTHRLMITTKKGIQLLVKGSIFKINSSKN